MTTDRFHASFRLRIDRDTAASPDRRRGQGRRARYSVAPSASTRRSPSSTRRLPIVSG